MDEYSRDLMLDDNDYYYNEYNNNYYNVHNRNVDIDNDIDTRSLRKETLTYINSDSIVEKTLKKAFRQKVVSRQPLNVAKSLSDMNSIASSATHSLGMGFSIQSGTVDSMNKTVKTNQTHNTADDKQFIAICWRAFNKFGVLQEQGDSLFDCCKKGLSVQKLQSALQDISHSINISFVEQIIETHFSSKFYMISWNEFKKLATEIISADRENKRLGLLQSNNINGGTKNNLLTTGSSIMSSNSVTNLLPTQAISNETAYTKLLQKQRHASTFSVRNSIPITKPNEFNHSYTEVGGEFIHSNKLNEAIIESFKKEARMARKDDDIERMMNQIPTAQPTSAVKTKVKEEEEDLSNKRFTQPLIKERMQPLFNKKDNVYVKWEQTKKKRDERILRENKKHARADMISLWNRITFAEDKEIMDKKLATDKQIQDEIAKSKYYEQRSLQFAMKENIHRNKSEDVLRKSQSASIFKDALNSSMELERETREEMLAEKRSMRPFGGMRISEESSGLVAIPQEIKVKIKAAKRLTEYEAAKKEEKEYFNQTMAYRLALISKKKSAAIKKAVQIGAPISLSPLKGEDLFNDNSYFDDTSNSYYSEYQKRSRSYDNDDNDMQFGEGAFDLSQTLKSR